MSRNPSIASINAMLRNAVSIADPVIERIPCGYVVNRREVEFSDDDHAWFRGPIKGGK